MPASYSPRMYTDTSLSVVERKYMDFDLAKKRNLTRSDVFHGLNTYPMVDGAAIRLSGDYMLGYANSHTEAFNMEGNSTYEILIGRKISNVN